MNLLKCPRCPSVRGKTSQFQTKYRSRSEVVNHLKTKHGMIFYHCLECDDDFESELVHRNYHTEYPHQCSHCQKAFNKHGGFLKHLQRDHPEKIGLHLPEDAISVKTDVPPCRGESLLGLALDLGFGTNIQLISKDYFVAGVEAGVTKVTIHAITPLSTMRSIVLTSRVFSQSKRPQGKHMGHLATAADFGYDVAAHEASYDDLNWAYMTLSMNALLTGFEIFARTVLAPKWDELIIVTVVMYGDTDRTASKIGKAILMTRDGESSKLLCFIFTDEDSQSSFWKRTVSLDKFRDDFDLPNLFSEIPYLTTCGDEKGFNCIWRRCTAVYLTASARDSHVRSCPIQNDPKAQKYDTEHKDLFIPCLNCMLSVPHRKDLESHIKTFHVQKGSWKRGKADSSSSSPATPSLDKGVQNEEVSEVRAKIAKLIETNPLSSGDTNFLTELLQKKTPIDGLTIDCARIL